FNITAFPPIDLVPEPLRGRTFVIVRGCFSGARSGEAGKELVDEWRSWREPLMDMWTTMPFARSAEISMDPVDPVPASSSGRWLERLDRSVLDAMLDAVVGDGGPSPMLFAEVRHGGGAVQRTNPDVSFAARDGERLLELVGWSPGRGSLTTSTPAWSAPGSGSTPSWRRCPASSTSSRGMSASSCPPGRS